MISLIGKKIGMTQIFTENGTLVPVTVLKFDPNYVVGQRDENKDGYSAVVLGTGEIKEKRVTKPYKGQFPEGVSPQRHLQEFKEYTKEVAVGDTIGVDVFENTVFVDVCGLSKGKGYQGVMKRHGFGGGRSTHGSKFHRANGSTGMAAYPSKVNKGTKMAGRMGADRVTVQNLKIVQIDTENQLLLVRGAVPGARNSMVVVSAAKKKN